ncbi:MAG TPA: GDSL-type esterase/lipase family protein [Blastocatellia bacterium]|nr:GDSL-type esterase/lipase family protein [Blastocatellia bacterium]
MKTKSLLKRIVLLGCLLGLSVQAQTPAHDFSRWEKDIAAFEQNDRTTPPPLNAIVFTGSSTILLWKTMAEDLPDHKVINRGFGGSQIVDATHFADRIIFPLKPKMVLIRSGGNDIFSGKSPEQVFADFKDFVAKIHGKLPKTEIVYIALSPSVARWNQADKERVLNAMVKEFVKTSKNVKYLDDADISLGPDGKPRPELFIADKLHFNAEGYKLFSAKVRAFLSK